MEFKPLICPQCGGEIENYSPGQTMATCSYCGTRFLVDPRNEPAPPVYEPVEFSSPNPQATTAVIALIVIFLVGGVIVTAFISGIKGTSQSRSGTAKPIASPVGGKPVLAPTPNPNLLEFGGKGTENGQFQDANSIAVDKQGRIYVSDDSLRVQQFDDKGTYLRTIQIPAKTGNYDHARTIDKIAVGDDGKLYVAVGGVIQVYDENATKLSRVMEVAPDYIQDFALKSDGGMVMIYDNDRIETLIVVTKTGKITKRISGFHTKALDAALSPKETAIEAIRLAVDGTGNIFSVYAFGDLGSYSLSSNADELMIARFSPDGKFVNKFVQTMNSCGIEVDSQGRIYLSANDSIQIYSNTGETVSTISGLSVVNAFALDKDNNVYAIALDRVMKRAAIP
ncbi:MAG TPA: hypothetical protein VHQ01_13165 [Pyrinomonadaceae bacterium]|nr:hypothetical protein [Pyrinomonadaceae bacterium]